MATQILATGTGAANSSDLVVAAGTPVTVCLKGTSTARAIVRIQLKDDAAAYNTIGTLSTPDDNAKVIDAPGTYRFQRIAASGICGVFRD